MKYQNVLLYLHGLLGSPASDRIAYLQGKGVKIFAPLINYDQTGLLSSLSAQYFHQNIDCIMGFSAGGLLGFCLAQQYKCDALLFNPALSYGLIRQDTKEYLLKANTDYKGRQTIVLGLQDDTVNPHTTEYVLEKYQHAQYCNILKEQDVGHRIDFSTFVRICEAYL
ncbi:MAG: hypothetical protein EAZ55_05345 [Cytophagales bacterium]|nr:MAG: hypothetical protein EAZ55_05345 [Cytophagales bacterium]